MEEIKPLNHNVRKIDKSFCSPQRPDCDVKPAEIVNPEDGGSMFLWNVENLPTSPQKNYDQKFQNGNIHYCGKLKSLGSGNFC